MAGQLVQPLDTNRGVEFHFDYFASSIWDDVRAVACMVLRMVRLAGDLSDFEIHPGARFFKVRYFHPSGISLYAEHVSGGGFCSVELKGEAAGCLDLEVLRREFQFMRDTQVRFKVSRLDLCFDQRSVDPRMVEAAIVAGDVRSPAERESLKVVSEPLKVDSCTVYFGSRESERMLRCYPKGDGVNRVELELKGARATAVLMDLLSLEVARWPVRSLAHLLDFVEFQFPAWREFIGNVERAKLVLARLAVTLEQKAAWLFNSVARVMALVREAYGAEFFEAVMLHGYERIRESDRALLTLSGAAVNA